MPPELFDLTELVSLGIAYTKIQEIPKDVLKLLNLQQMTCQGTPLDKKMSSLADRGIKYVKRHYVQQEAKDE